MFLKIFDKLLQENGLNKRQFSIKSGIPYTTIDGFYKKGYENIRLTTLRKIADYFNVSLDYLFLGKEPHIDNENLLKIQKYYDILNEKGKEKALEYLKDLSGNPKYKTVSTSEQIKEDIASDLADRLNIAKSSI